MKKLFQELKRRNVFKETIAYLVVAWLLLQVFDVVLSIWTAPNWILQVITITLALGLPLWIAFSWHYQITSSGIKKTRVLNSEYKSSKVNRILNTTIIVSLIALICLIWANPGIVTPKITNRLSIAVLPFTNMSDDKTNDWFSVGVTEDILTHLSKVKGLRVISRTSVMPYKDSDKSLPEIARELDVSFIVEGSVRKQNDQVLITAQLLNADDEHLWAENYNENLIDAFEIQQEVSRKIVNQLKVYLSPEEERALKKQPVRNAIAYELFSRGRVIADERTKENLERSLDLYKEAIIIDSLYAEAYAEIANTYMLLIGYGGLKREEASSEAKKYIYKALEIDSTISRPYSVLAFISLGSDWEKAKVYFEKAIELNPNDATAHQHFAIYFRDRPNPDSKKMLEHILEAHKLDPLSKPVNQMTIAALLVNDQIDDAQNLLEKTRFALNPDEIVYLEGMINSARKKDLRELIYSYENALKGEPENIYLLQTLSNYYQWILLDRNRSLQYSKRVFEIDPKRSDYIIDKLYDLYHKKKFEEAKKILEDSSSVLYMNSIQEKVMLHDFYLFQNKYKEAASVLEELKEINIVSYYSNKAWSYSRMGDQKMTFQIFKNPNYNSNDLEKTIIFANLKEPDSVFYYLNKISNNAKLDLKYFRLMVINGSFEMDPYRNDPRFIEIMKKNYFPVKDKPN